MGVLSVGRRTSEAATVNLGDVLGLEVDGPAARAYQMARGAWEPERDPRLRGRRLPLVLVEGAVLHVVTVRGREGADLLGPGDLVPVETGTDIFGARRRVLVSGRFAVLDERVFAAAAGEPALTVALADVAVRRAGALAGQVVLAQLVAIDDRLRILLPSLAERWGKVTADGVVLPAFLSHTVLSALVGARRPSLTAAVGRLVEDGTVRRLPDRRWLLPGGLDGIG
jgi:CRP/FNR family transcriptional regulator, cyclic AMP receptor protein